jgi:hypothetical protein
MQTDFVAFPIVPQKLSGLWFLLDHIKTALGISSSFFQSIPEQVLYRSGQGSSSSPPLWMAISIILFCTLEAQMGIGATYLCLQSTLTTNHTTEAFVDNSTNFVNSSTNENQDTADQLN